MIPTPARLSRSEAIARHVEQEILKAGYRGGERLGSKHDFKMRFQVASGTVSEALRILEGRGLVETRPGPGGGVFVAARLSHVRFHLMVLGFKAPDAPFSDFLAIRDALESLVCRDAMEHHVESDVQEMCQILDDMEQRIDQPVAFLRDNWRLHRRIAEIGRNAPLKTLYLTLIDFVQGSLESAEPDPSLDLRRNWTAHKRLVDAIVARDDEALEIALRRHWTPHRKQSSRSL